MRRDKRRCIGSRPPSLEMGWSTATRATRRPGLFARLRNSDTHSEPHHCAAKTRQIRGRRPRFARHDPTTVSWFGGSYLGLDETNSARDCANTWPLRVRYNLLARPSLGSGFLITKPRPRVCAPLRLMSPSLVSKAICRCAADRVSFSCRSISVFLMPGSSATRMKTKAVGTSIAESWSRSCSNGSIRNSRGLLFNFPNPLPLSRILKDTIWL